MAPFPQVSCEYHFKRTIPFSKLLRCSGCVCPLFTYTNASEWSLLFRTLTFWIWTSEFLKYIFSSWHKRTVHSSDQKVGTLRSYCLANVVSTTKGKGEVPFFLGPTCCSTKTTPKTVREASPAPLSCLPGSAWAPVHWGSRTLRLQPLSGHRSLWISKRCMGSSAVWQLVTLLCQYCYIFNNRMGNFHFLLSIKFAKILYRAFILHNQYYHLEFSWQLFFLNNLKYILHLTFPMFLKTSHSWGQVLKPHFAERNSREKWFFFLSHTVCQWWSQEQKSSLLASSLHEDNSPFKDVFSKSGKLRMNVCDIIFDTSSISAGTPETCLLGKPRSGQRGI